MLTLEIARIFLDADPADWDKPVPGICQETGICHEAGKEKTGFFLPARFVLREPSDAVCAPGNLGPRD